MEIRANLSNTQTMEQSQPQAAANVSLAIPQADVYVADQDYGGLRLGFGSTASYSTNEFDLSGSFIAHYVGAAEVDGGFAFRQNGAALVPNGPGGKLVLSPNGALGPRLAASSTILAVWAATIAFGTARRSGMGCSSPHPMLRRFV